MALPPGDLQPSTRNLGEDFHFQARCQERSCSLSSTYTDPGIWTIPISPGPCQTSSSLQACEAFQVTCNYTYHLQVAGDYRISGVPELNCSGASTGKIATGWWNARNHTLCCHAQFALDGLGRAEARRHIVHPP